MAMEDAGAPSKIREISETSIDRDYTIQDGAGERKQSTTEPTTSESIEEGPDVSTRREKSEEEHERGIAQQKRNRRVRAQPGAKRGGRRDTGKSSWGRLLGRKKTVLKAGDLIEAEWAGSGWWYVGCITGECVEGEGSSDGTRRKSGRRTKDEFHVVFADGDEAYIRGRDLKPIRATDNRGQPTGYTDTTLPRHVPVVDLGSGRLHGNQKLPHGQNSAGRGNGEFDQRKKGVGKKHSSKSITTDGDGASSLEHPLGVAGQPLPQGANVGDIEERLRQGESAVWGGRVAPDGPAARGSHGNSCGSGSGDWWETGTQYVFQPRLSADKATVLSLAAARSRQDGGVDFDRGRFSRDRGGGSVGGSQMGSRTHSVATGLSPSHRQRQSHEGQKSSGELMRIVKVPESNPNHGNRIFFVA